MGVGIVGPMFLLGMILPPAFDVVAGSERHVISFPQWLACISDILQASEHHIRVGLNTMLYLFFEESHGGAMPHSNIWVF